MLAATDLRGLYAIIPTPATPDADRGDATETVNLEESARVVNRLIADGVSGLIALGTMGECATLTGDEFETFADCVLRTVDGRVPTFIGTTALGTHETLQRMRFVRERGADGTLLGLPMWQPCTTEMAVQHYRMVAEAFPDVAIMVYANARAFRFDFDAEFWRQVTAQAPTVMSAKYSNAAKLPEMLEAVDGQVNFVPNDDAAFRFAQVSARTTTACWAPALGPRPSIALMNAILAGDMARAEAIAQDVEWAGEPVKIVTSSPEIFASYNIQLEKERINAAGYCNAGPVRPPYNVMPAEYVAAARECGQRWAQLAQKYGGGTTG